MPNRYLISIATYRRPTDLKRLLDSLAESLDARADIVVTDNDSNRSAHETVCCHPLAPTYLVETTPGIASARNRGLQYFTEKYFAVIFLDDDEWVSPTWFSELTSFLEGSAADVVQGPVHTELPPDAGAWVHRGGFYQRRTRASGTILPSAATNNTAMRYDAWVAAGRPSFDTAFSETGGSDWDLFWGVRKSGAHIVYCAEAVVSEDVPPSRLSVSWLRQRYIRNGIVEVRVRRKHGDPLAGFFLRAIAAAAVGSLQLAFFYITGKGLQAKPLSRVLISYGKFAGLVGVRIREYKR